VIVHPKPSQRLNKPLIPPRATRIITLTLNPPLHLPLRHPFVILTARTNSTVLTIIPISIPLIITITTSQ
jgi:hypothetical protein